MRSALTSILLVIRKMKLKKNEFLPSFEESFSLLKANCSKVCFQASMREAVGIEANEFFIRQTPLFQHGSSKYYVNRISVRKMKKRFGKRYFELSVHISKTISEARINIIPKR